MLLQILNLLQQHPRLLRSSRGLNHKLSALSTLLPGAFPSHNALVTWVTNHPQLLLYSSATLRAKFDALVRVSGLEQQQVVQTVLAQPHVLLKIQV